MECMVILKDLNSPIKKPNALNTLGGILSVRTPPAEYMGKFTEKEALMVSMCLLWIWE